MLGIPSSQGPQKKLKRRCAGELSGSGVLRELELIDASVDRETTDWVMIYSDQSR